VPIKMSNGHIFIPLLLLVTIFFIEGYAKKEKDPNSKRTIREIPAFMHEEPSLYSSLHQPNVQPTTAENANQFNRPYIQKPKSLKILSSYEVCKQECRRQRDQESEKEYVERLREELRFAEEQLTLQQKERELNAQVQATTPEPSETS